MYRYNKNNCKWLKITNLFLCRVIPEFSETLVTFKLNTIFKNLALIKLKLNCRISLVKSIFGIKKVLLGIG